MTAYSMPHVAMLPSCGIGETVNQGKLNHFAGVALRYSTIRDGCLAGSVPECDPTLLQVLQAQEDAVQSVQQEARDALLAIAGNIKQYQTLLTDLLVRACTR